MQHHIKKLKWVLQDLEKRPKEQGLNPSIQILKETISVLEKKPKRVIEIGDNLSYLILSFLVIACVILAGLIDKL